MIILRSVSFDHCLNKAFKNIFTVSLNKTDLENSTNQVSGKVNFPLLEVCNSFFTTPKLNLISDNMMSNKTKQVPDKQYTHLCIKTWKIMYAMQGFKGTIFCCVRVCKRKRYNFLLCVFFLTSYFTSERDPGVVIKVLLVLQSGQHPCFDIWLPRQLILYIHVILSMAMKWHVHVYGTRSTMYMYVWFKQMPILYFKNFDFVSCWL